MTELEKIEYAKTYIEKLANGVNPLTGQAAPDSDLINNVRISRCLFYVSDILRQVVENGGISKHRGKAKNCRSSSAMRNERNFVFLKRPFPLAKLPGGSTN